MGERASCLHFNTALPALPLLFVSVPATDLPLNVFTFSSFDCSQSTLFYFTGESEIPGFFPTQAELNTAPTGRGDGARGRVEERDSNPKDLKCTLVANNYIKVKI